MIQFSVCFFSRAQPTLHNLRHVFTSAAERVSKSVGVAAGRRRVRGGGGGRCVLVWVASARFFEAALGGRLRVKTHT
jgi:hypothetical protein